MHGEQTVPNPERTTMYVYIVTDDETERVVDVFARERDADDFCSEQNAAGRNYGYDRWEVQR